MGLDVAYEGDGPFYAIQDGQRMLAPLGFLDSTAT